MKAQSAFLSALLAGPLIAASLGGCKSPEAPKAGTPEVVVETVVRRNIAIEATYPAQTMGSREVEVRPRLTGILLKRSYQEGHPVNEGQPLYQIDPAEFRTALDQAESQYAQQKAVLDKARRDLARVEPLLKEKAVAQKDVDDARSAMEQAQAALLTAQANVTKARLNLDYTRVASPVSGIASLSLMSEGSLVNGPSSLLTKVVQIDPMYVMFSLPEREKLYFERKRAAGMLDLPHKAPLEVQLTLADGTVYPVSGRLNFSDTLISTSTGTLQLRAELPNAKAQLMPGQFVKVTLKGIEAKDAIVIPQKAVGTSAQGQFVYVVGEDGVAHSRPVETAGTQGDRFFISKGLEAGDQVVVEGLAKVRADKPVKLVVAEQPARPATAAR
ncbi:efflux RND transporter periplasmic adaptor subunit [Niveibacterium sp.]|uniref:efflux RND transporter periplasmic adaptor subunit n=1 Tax=Niveibacterium sp. TaxID=2017444 RepID=UPI0035B3067A